MKTARSLSLMLALGALTAAPTLAQRVQRVQVSQPEHVDDSRFVDNGRDRGRARGERRGRVRGERRGRARRAQRELIVRQMNVVEGRRGNLQLRYNIESRGAAELRIEVHGARRVREVHATVQARGRVALGRAGRGHSTLVRVHAVGRRGQTLPIRYGRSRAQQLEFEVAHQRTRTNDTRRRTVRNGETWVEDDSREETGNEVRVRTRRRGGQNISAVSAACDRAFTGNAAESRCLEIALAIRNPIESIRACDEAFTGNAAALSCLEQAPNPIHVSVCDDLMTGDSSEFQCIAAFAGARADAATTREVARACDARTGDAAELACVQQVLSAQRAPRRGGARR